MDAPTPAKRFVVAQSCWIRASSSVAVRTSCSSRRTRRWPVRLSRPRPTNKQRNYDRRYDWPSVDLRNRRRSYDTQPVAGAHREGPLSQQHERWFGGAMDTADRVASSAIGGAGVPGGSVPSAT